MSPRTIFISRLFGLYSLIMAVFMLGGKQALLDFMAAMGGNGPLPLVLGLMATIGGLALVLVHNIWSGGALPVVVTLLNWSILARGLGLLWLSGSAEARAAYYAAFHVGDYYPVYVVITAALGAYLTWGGFKRSA